jgi:hypothetical protein
MGLDDREEEIMEFIGRIILAVITLIASIVLIRAIQKL